MKDENLPLGILSILTACICFASMNVLASYGAGHATPYMMVLFQSIFSFAFVFPFAIKSGFAPLKTNRILLLFMRAFTGTLTLFFIFVALAYMPMTSATLLTYSAPLWMPVIGFLALRTRVGWHVWVSVMIGFAGIFLVLKPNGQEIHFSSLIALCGAASMAVTYFIVRRLTTTEPMIRIIFYYFLFSALITLLLAPFLWQTPDMRGWLSLAGLGLALALSQVFVTLACTYMDPTKISPYIYSVIAFTALFDHLIWGQALTSTKYLGMALVLLGGVLTATIERHKKNLKS